MREHITLRNFLAIFVAALLIAGIMYFFTKRQEEEELVVPEPQTLSVEDELEETLRYEIPEDAEKAELRSTSDPEAKAIASRRVVNGILELSILADLAEGVYEAFLVRGEEGSEEYSEIPAGELILAKGGYLLEFESAKEIGDHNKIVVKEGDEVVFEGSF